MRPSLLSFVAILALPFGAMGQTYNYAPNMLNIPCFAQKGDATVGLGWGRGVVFQALEIQAAYSPIPHLAVMVNYFAPREKYVRNRSAIGTDFYLWEGAIGIYEKIPKGAASLFAGFGSGRLFSNYGFDRVANFDLNRWFVQPGFSYRSNFFQAGLALRLSHLTYKSGVVSYSIEAPDIQYIQNIEKNSPIFLPELGLQIGMRLKPLVISLNIASIFPNTSSWNFNRLNTGLSIALDFGVRKEKKKEQGD